MPTITLSFKTNDATDLQVRHMQAVILRCMMELGIFWGAPTHVKSIADAVTLSDIEVIKSWDLNVLLEDDIWHEVSTEPPTSPQAAAAYSELMPKMVIDCDLSMKELVTVLKFIHESFISPDPICNHMVPGTNGELYVLTGHSAHKGKYIIKRWGK